MSPKSKEQFSEMRSKSEQKIITAALGLFAHKGFKATTISQIAKEAGVSKGLMYNYFDSKNALLRQIIKAAIEEGKTLLDSDSKEFKTAEEELTHLVLTSIGYMKKNIDLLRLLTMLSFQPEVMESIVDLVEDSTNFSIEYGTILFSKLGAANPMQSALLLGATLDGMALHLLYKKDEYPIDEMAKITVQTFLNKNSIHRRK